jgi:hypothetical protein
MSARVHVDINAGGLLLEELELGGAPAAVCARLRNLCLKPITCPPLHLHPSSLHARSILKNGALTVSEVTLSGGYDHQIAGGEDTRGGYNHPIPRNSARAVLVFSDSIMAWSVRTVGWIIVTCQLDNIIMVAMEVSSGDVGSVPYKRTVPGQADAIAVAAGYVLDGCIDPTAVDNDDIVKAAWAARTPRPVRQLPCVRSLPCRHLPCENCDGFGISKLTLGGWRALL